MSVPMTDSESIEGVMEMLSCDDAVARHYLSLFNNDVSRTVETVTSYGGDNDWWGHPWHSRWQGKEASDNVAEENYCDAEQGFDSHRMKGSGGVVPVIDLSGPNTEGGVESDEGFYLRYAHLVDKFVEAVCRNEGKDDLRLLIAEADRAIVVDNPDIQGESDLVNRRSFKHSVHDGRSPLTYAAGKNLEQQVYNLIELGAEVSKVMSGYASARVCLPHTALSIAATNGKRDGTEMVRILLSKGADPSELVSAGVNEKELNRGMRYWIDKARRVGVPARVELAHMAKLPPMDRIHELDYAVVGEEAAISMVQEALAGRFGNPQANRKPLVLLLLGPPGHGKTYFSSNTARSLVGEENFLFVPCQSIRDDADLFGSRLGGSRGGEYSSDGQLTAFLRERQGKNCIVFLDEFEKMKDLTSSLGWGQAKKIYQSFLEPWNDGTLSDQGALSGDYKAGGKKSSASTGGEKIDCSQSIWIMTSNWGQNDIIAFGEKHKARVHEKIDQKDVAWIQKNLVNKILRPLCTRKFASVDEELKALCRRIDGIVPFLPFTTKERRVVADIALIERFSVYREPCVLSGPPEKRRSFGNLFLRSSSAFAAHTAESYDPIQGASAMLSTVQQADGKLQMMFLRAQLGLTDDQKARLTSPEAPDQATDEPELWVHYDKDAEAISIVPSRPVDDDPDSDSSIADDNDEGGIQESASGGEGAGGLDAKDAGVTSRKRSAADDVF